ncbi:hypothetical protein HDU82_009009 [Entophlyctis luteolus]|nr:hypothetical protein HDU82_009009 [Entophlyctis luteolus]
MSIRQFSIYSAGAAHTLMGALSRILRYIDQVPEIVVITPGRHQDDASNNIVDAETDNYEPIPMKSMNPENPSMLPLEVMTSALIYTNEKKVEDPFMTVNDQLLVSPPASPTANQANWNFILSSNARVDMPVVPSDSLYSVSLENSGGQLADSIFSENRTTKGQNVSPSMTDFSMVSPAASVLVFGDSSSLWASQHRKVSFGVIAEIDETQDNVDGYVSSADDGDILPERGIAIPQGRGKKTFEN